MQPTTTTTTTTTERPTTTTTTTTPRPTTRRARTTIPTSTKTAPTNYSDVEDVAFLQQLLNFIGKLLIIIFKKSVFQNVVNYVVN